MKKFLILLTCLLLTFSCANAQEQFDGQVIAGREVVVSAPFGGKVQDVLIRPGVLVEAGDPLASMASTRVTAPEDGTIRGIFAAEGDDASTAVMYLMPTNRYTVSASISKAYKSAETRYVTIGEQVWLRCTRDGSHRAVGVITAVNDASYTVETTGGELYMEETVNIYRTADYNNKQLIGTGTVSRTAATAITGSGCVWKLHVASGEAVERGQLLFETIPALPGANVGDGVIRSDLSGVVSQVKVADGQQINQGDALIAVCPREDFLIQMSIPQDMLSSVTPGDACQIFFSWNDGQHEPLYGTVTEISYIGESTGSETTYAAYVSFAADESVRLGMNVTVIPAEKEAEP